MTFSGMLTCSDLLTTSRDPSRVTSVLWADLLPSLLRAHRVIKAAENVHGGFLLLVNGPALELHFYTSGFRA